MAKRTEETDLRVPTKRIFLALWDKAKESDNYSKKEWLELSTRLDSLLLFRHGK